MNFFEGWQEFSADGATVPFFKTSKDGVNFIGFDSRHCPPPEPMINGLVAVKLADANTKIIMVNHKFPAGLVPKLQAHFEIEREDLEGGAVKMTFCLKAGADVSAVDMSLCH